MNLDKKTRLNVVLYEIVPAICDHKNKKFQLKMLEKHECIAKKLNAECGYPVADIHQLFDEARKEVERN
ncbi:MAG: hypothetical protein P1P85_04120 [Patescibacteria group bacterium]|nr:hypothetical protein [Patescibacteria group bacterium]